jgi:hypothetical protein
MPIINSEVRSGQLKVACGRWAMVAAVDTVATGLRKVLHVVASMETDNADTMSWVSALPSATVDGSITIKGWRNTSGTDPTPAAIATTFGQVVHWIAIGY